MNRGGLRGQEGAEIAVVGGLAYMAASAGVLAVDIDTPRDLPVMAEIALPSEIRGLTLVDPAPTRPIPFSPRP